MGCVAEQQDTAAVCPEPNCVAGMIEKRIETATKFQVSWSRCPVCEGDGTVPVWKAAEWRARHPNKQPKRTISGVVRKA